MEESHYDVLEIPGTAPRDEIRAAFRRLVQTYHPDHNPGFHEVANERLRRLNEAYSVLRDPAKRRAYDAELARRKQRARAGANASDAVATDPRDRASLAALEGELKRLAREKLTGYGVGIVRDQFLNQIAGELAIVLLSNQTQPNERFETMALLQQITPEVCQPFIWVASKHQAWAAYPDTAYPFEMGSVVGVSGRWGWRYGGLRLTFSDGDVWQFRVLPKARVDEVSALIQKHRPGTPSVVEPDTERGELKWPNTVARDPGYAFLEQACASLQMETLHSRNETEWAAALSILAVVQTVRIGYVGDLVARSAAALAAGLGPDAPRFPPEAPRLLEQFKTWARESKLEIEQAGDKLMAARVFVKDNSSGQTATNRRYARLEADLALVPDPAGEHLRQAFTDVLDTMRSTWHWTLPCPSARSLK